MTISTMISEQAYEVASAVYLRRITRKKAIDKLVSEIGMNEGSASDHIENLRHMLRGEVYQRTMNTYTTQYFLDRIRDDFGPEAFTAAISALEQHIIYYEGIRKVRRVELREIHQASVNSLRAEQKVLVTAGAPYAAPKASDLGEPPDRVQLMISRIIRDNALADLVKALHKYECQICGHTILLSDGLRYAEAHHIRPLGRPHDGPDVRTNILCLCPNHHAECDFGVTFLDASTLRSNDAHQLSPEFIRYHNECIYRQARAP